MLRQIKLLLRVQTCNLFGMNEARYGKRGKQRGARIALMCAMALVTLVLCGYVAGLCYALCAIGAGNAIPMLLALVTGVVVLMLTMFRAGPVIFDLHSYEQLIALPLRPTAIVVSRFLRMYLGDVGMALAVLLPGTIVAGVMLHPGAAYCVMMLLGALVLPLIPMTLATLLGALVYAISARMRRRSLAVIVLTLLMTLLLIAGAMLLSTVNDMDDARVLGLISALVNRIGSFYPPAKWFGSCVTGGSLGGYAALAAGSLAFFALVASAIGANFHRICAALSARVTRGHYAMSDQRSRSAFAALYLRELRRYAASPVYVMNTLIGGLIAVLMGVGALVAVKRVPLLTAMLSEMGALPAIPFVVAFMFVIAPSTSCSISLEGKQWWQIKCLPLSDKQILDAKFALYLMLTLPCWVVTVVLLTAALHPSGAELMWLLLVPLAYILFSGALGMRMNLAMPSFSWENENQPVKQSRAVGFTMLLGFAASALPAAGAIVLPEVVGRWLPVVVAVALLAGALLLYRSCMRVRLRELN
ncbi:MAG: hypothetical protein Q4G06_09260 [Clostridia bacterium]|nr:hypothetical protein [Clostridia bacterium]